MRSYSELDEAKAPSSATALCTTRPRTSSTSGRAASPSSCTYRNDLNVNDGSHVSVPPPRKTYSSRCQRGRGPGLAIAFTVPSAFSFSPYWIDTFVPAAPAARSRIQPVSVRPMSTTYVPGRGSATPSGSTVSETVTGSIACATSLPPGGATRSAGRQSLGSARASNVSPPNTSAPIPVSNDVGAVATVHDPSVATTSEEPSAYSIVTCRSSFGAS